MINRAAAWLLLLLALEPSGQGIAFAMRAGEARVEDTGRVGATEMMRRFRLEVQSDHKHRVNQDHHGLSSLNGDTRAGTGELHTGTLTNAQGSVSAQRPTRFDLADPRIKDIFSLDSPSSAGASSAAPPVLPHSKDDADAVREPEAPSGRTSPVQPERPAARRVAAEVPPISANTGLPSLQEHLIRQSGGAADGQASTQPSMGDASDHFVADPLYQHSPLAAALGEQADGARDVDATDSTKTADATTGSNLQAVANEGGFQVDMGMGVAEQKAAVFDQANAAAHSKDIIPSPQMHMDMPAEPTSVLDPFRAPQAGTADQDAQTVHTDTAPDVPSQNEDERQAVLPSPLTGAPANQATMTTTSLSVSPDGFIPVAADAAPLHPDQIARAAAARSLIAGKLNGGARAPTSGEAVAPIVAAGQSSDQGSPGDGITTDVPQAMQDAQDQGSESGLVPWGGPREAAEPSELPGWKPNAACNGGDQLEPCLSINKTRIFFSYLVLLSGCALWMFSHLMDKDRIFCFIDGVQETLFHMVAACLLWSDINGPIDRNPIRQVQGVEKGKMLLLFSAVIFVFITMGKAGNPADFVATPTKQLGFFLIFGLAAAAGAGVIFPKGPPPKESGEMLQTVLGGLYLFGTGMVYCTRSNRAQRKCLGADPLKAFPNSVCLAMGATN